MGDVPGSDDLVECLRGMKLEYAVEPMADVAGVQLEVELP